MVTRSKTRVKARGVAPSKVPLLKEGIDVPIENGPLSGIIGGVTKVDAPLLNGKGLKGVGKVKTFVAQVPVVSPNSFDVLIGPGETSGTKDADTSNT
ncbi:hypothetical protein LIER_37428 [Lithospermum erythrorhizon]|uniref:Uncharacterized protein n=1 Tax=Lithospermum erythrorhizon TaxID=34254 RepID=A0AAV3PKC5_LITER